MRRRFNLHTKITGLVVVLVTLAVIIASLISFELGRSSLEAKYQENLSLIAKNKVLEIDLLLQRVSENLQFAQANAKIQVNKITPEDSSSAEMFMDPFADPFADAADNDPFAMDVMPVASEENADQEALLMSLKEAYGLRDIYITSTSGVIQTATRPGMVDQNFPDPASVISKTSSGLHFSDIYGKRFFAGLPIENGNDKSLLIFEIDADELNSILSDTLGLGKSGEVLLVSRSANNQNINILNTLRHKPSDSIEVVEPSSRKGVSLEKALNGESGESFDIDYRGKEVLAAYQPVAKSNWAVVAKIDTDEIYGSTSGMLMQYGIGGLLLLIASGFLSLIVSKQVTRPINTLKSNLDLLRNGILPERIDRMSQDEIGDMAENVNQLNESLKATARFAQEIGEGNFDADYQPVSNNDALGNALINMRDNLIEAEKRDKERNWIVTGVAEVGEILRSGDNLEELGDEVIKFIIDKIGAVQGAFYVLNDDNEDDKALEIYASYAYNRKKYLNARFRFAEGLIGQAAAEKDTILRTEIPDDYLTITSGILGEARPGCLLIVPLVAEEKVYGALEFAGYQKFTPSEVRFVEELSVITARTVFNIKVNERTRKLLAESQAMSAELQEKQEILRQNAEEMQATQEELQRSNQRLEEQVEEVNRTQRRMQILLENASEVITIYDEEGTIQYVSPSVEPILGYSQSEMKGTHDIEKVHPDQQEAFKKLFDKLLSKPDEQVTIQYEYQTKEGDYIWMEATGSNFLANPAIQGLVINSQNITERKRAEAEQRMRSKMQALSENSPDLITRLEHGLISYINPVIEEYTGQRPETYINQQVDETELNPKVLEQWLSIVEQVRGEDKTVKTEMDFPSNMGERIMQVSAIPEYDENESLESVLVVSHDITERKLIELEIQNKNKKIADSINYAKRIQNAILPDNSVITKTLPDSFILYKPKDVVSGDFPWYLEVGDSIFIAAVDCTGHGVPGALLSLIGYFLLNDIVRSRKITDPGKILDILDEGVTSTLRQDQNDSQTKDGMDIALCRIDKKTRKVEFAGAHRPLYVMKNGEMEEIKGNKFAIGGGIYKNQTNFTSHTIDMAKDDSIFFCSDGFPDQFGGPQNRKFGPKQLRELISELHELPMQDACRIFDEKWESWKADEKQTDDVLLIGIKF